MELLQDFLGICSIFYGNMYIRYVPRVIKDFWTILKKNLQITKFSCIKAISGNGQRSESTTLLVKVGSGEVPITFCSGY
jgi:hypothetical protein